MLAAVLYVIVGLTGSAQDNPVASAARELGQRGLAEAKAPSSRATGFRPSGKRSYVATFAAGVSKEPDEREGLIQALSVFIDGYEESAKEGKYENDVAGALGFSITLLFGAAKGVEVSEATLTTLIGNLQAALDQPGVAGATDAQKQEFYEHALCSVGFWFLLASATESDAQKAQVKTLAANTLELLTGAKLDQFEVKGNALLIRGTSTGALAQGFSFSPPSGWQKSGNWWVKSKVEDRGGGPEVRSVLVMFLPAVRAQGNMGDALRHAWEQAMPKGFDGRAGGMVYRRYVGDGLFSQFIFGRGREEGRRSDTLYTLFMVDCGQQWQPVLIAQIYEDQGMIKSGEAMMASMSYTETWPLADEALAALRGPGAKYAPIVSSASLVGHYHFGSSAQMQWENIYTGATSMTFVSYGGELNLAANGTFTYRFVSASGQVGAMKTGNARGSGTYRIERDILICTFKEYDQGDSYKVKEYRYRIAGLTEFAGGEKVAVLIQRLDLTPGPISLGDSSQWYSTKKK